MTEQRLYSVTSLIKLGLGTGDGLVNWNVRTTAEAAYDKLHTLTAFKADNDRDGAVKWLADQRWQRTGKAAARGTDLHTAAEHVALGQTPQVEPHIQPYLDQYLRFLQEHAPTFLLAEAPVYSPSHGYAGTTDGVIVLDDVPLVFDIKTTEHAPDSGRARPPFPEVALQLVAYRRAELVGVLAERRFQSGKRYYVFDPDQQHEPMPRTDGGVCVVVSPFDYEVHMIRTDDEVWRCFRHVMECARWQLHVSQTVVGPPITGSAR